MIICQQESTESHAITVDELRISKAKGNMKTNDEPQRATQPASPPTDVDYWSLDELLAHVGDYGKYQKILTLVLFVMVIPMSYPIIIMFFSSLDPAWRCRANSTVCNYTGTFTSTQQCAMNRSDWEFTKPDSFSFVTQFHAYCSHKWKVDLTRSVSFFGWGVGAFVMGWLGDKYGRKALLLPSMLATLLITSVTPFISSLPLLVVIRFFACFFIPGSTLSAFILITEVVGERKRVFSGTLIYVTVPLGMCLILPKYYLIEGWRGLCIACSVPYVVLLAFYPFLPESLQWLCEQGRADEVMNTLARIARWNKTQLPPNVRVKTQFKYKDASSSTSFVDIFRTRVLAIGTLINGFLWFVVGVSYWAIVMAADDLGWPLYVTFLVMNVTDMISSFVAIFLVNKIGRKKGSIVPTLLGGLFCVIVGVIPRGGVLGAVRVSCALIGKFMLSVSYNSIYVWTIQLYPTVIRAKGMGWAQINNRLGCTFAPWVTDWTLPLGAGAPFITLGVPTVVGVIMALKLPSGQLDGSKVDNNLRSS